MRLIKNGQVLIDNQVEKKDILENQDTQKKKLFIQVV